MINASYKAAELLMLSITYVDWVIIDTDNSKVKWSAQDHWTAMFPQHQDAIISYTITSSPLKKEIFF